MCKAAEVFAIPELLELILLSLPVATSQQELSSIRTIITCQIVCNTWRCLVKNSTRIRTFCYLSTLVPLPSSSPSIWDTRSETPSSIRHNPYISSLLLRGRHCGGIWPFNGDDQSSLYGSTAPQRWSFFFEFSRSEYMRFPATGPWRAMLATDPPFQEVWSTRTPQMTGIDSLLYKSSRGADAMSAANDGDDEEMWTPKMEAEFRFKAYQQSRIKQRSRRCCEGGFTLGATIDVVAELFESDPSAEWVVLESVRRRDAYMDVPVAE